MPEAIAIVCAPLRNPNYGIFRLTDPPGMTIVSQCKATMPFHAHPPAEIYKNITSIDSHAILVKDLPLRIFDLRK